MLNRTILFIGYFSLYLMTSTSTLALNAYAPVPERIASYKWFIDQGRPEHPRHVLLHGEAAWNFVHQAYNWVSLLEENTTQNLFQNLEKVSLRAKLLIDRRLMLQNFGLVQGQNLREAALLCQTSFAELFLTPNTEHGERRRRIERLKQHARIWWATLSIKRTAQNYAEAWQHLDLVDSPPYTRVAKLWQAHLIVRNNYSPTGNRANDLHAANLLLDQLRPENHPAAEPQVLLQELQAAQAQYQQQQQLAQQQNDHAPQAQPAPQAPEVHPDFVNSAAMRQLNVELRQEIANEQALMADNLANDNDDNDDDDNDHGHGHHSNSDTSSDSSDDDDDGFNNNNNNHFPINNNNNANSDHPSRTLIQFNELFPSSAHNDIDRLTVEFINRGSMPKDLITFLDANHTNVTPAPSKRDADRPLSNEASRKLNLRIAKLVYHYSQKAILKSGKSAFISGKVFDLFKNHLTVPGVTKRQHLHHYYSFGEIKANRSLFYTQLLSYRREILEKTVTINRITELCNAKYETRFSKMNIDFIKKEISVNDNARREILQHYRKNGLELLNEIGGRRKKQFTLSQFMYVVWHELKDDKLPAKELGNVSSDPKRIALTKDEKEFLMDEFQHEKDCSQTVWLREIMVRFNNKFNRNATYDSMRTWFKYYKTKGNLTLKLGFNHDAQRFLANYLETHAQPSYIEFGPLLAAEFGISIGKSTFQKQVKKLSEPTQKMTGGKRTREMDNSPRKIVKR